MSRVAISGLRLGTCGAAKRVPRRDGEGVQMKAYLGHEEAAEEWSDGVDNLEPAEQLVWASEMSAMDRCEGGSGRSMWGVGSVSSRPVQTSLVRRGTYASEAGFTRLEV
jgi:hypothetical protein